jgi:hypothetical protein
MNELVYKKLSKVVDMCLEKTGEISSQHSNYFIGRTKWGKRWNYYHALAGRLLKEQREMLDKEESRLNENN